MVEAKVSFYCFSIGSLNFYNYYLISFKMLRTKVEAVCGFILLLLSILTSAILPLLGNICFRTADRKKVKTNVDLTTKKQLEREEQFETIERQFQLNGKRQKILKLSEEKLINALQTRNLSATEVLEAFISKAIQVTRKINCITEFIPEALEWAAELDGLEQIKGPLHGVPVSIKEHCNVVGMDSTMGFAQFLFRPAQEDAVIVQALKELGAIPFCKTNVPQSLFSYGCGNDIYGETLNPLNIKLSPGGSSGGCAALIAAGGSILGVGTDIGGSIRIPAHFCGIAGMKPTSLRMTQQGFRSTGLVMVPVAGTNGFMARTSKMLVYAYQSLYSSGTLSLLDPNAVPLPWNENLFSLERKLRFGCYPSHPYFPTIGDTDEVVLRAVEKLRAAGHEVVRFHMPEIDQIMEQIFEFMFADKGECFRNLWEGECVSEAAVVPYWIARLPLWFRKILAFIMEFQLCGLRFPILHSPLMAKLLRAGNKSWTTNGLWKKMVERKAMMEYIKRGWLANNIDVLICPAFPFPAIPYTAPGKIIQAVAYTMPWNLFDFCAGVVNFGRETGKHIKNYEHRGDLVLRMAQKGAKVSVGMPIGVQIVGLPFQEELVLLAMSTLESLR